MRTGQIQSGHMHVYLGGVLADLLRLCHRRLTICTSGTSLYYTHNSLQPMITFFPVPPAKNWIELEYLQKRVQKAESWMLDYEPHPSFHA